MTIRVAVTGISGDAGLGAIRGLRATRAEDEDIWILGLDSGQDCAARHLVDAFASVPPVADSGYLDALIAQLRSHAIDVLLPGVDSEIVVLSRAHDRLRHESTKIAITPAELAEAADDKLATCAYLTERGIATPQTCDAGNPIDLGFPIIAKPRRGQGSKGVVLLEHEKQLEAFLSEARSGYCLQRYIDGPEITIGLLYDWDGVLRDAIAMERTLSEGRTIRAAVTNDPKIAGFIDDFGQRVKGAGAINVQLRVDPREGPQAFEINCRLSGSTAMRVAVGFNDPVRIVYNLTRGVPMQRAKVRQAEVYRIPTELVIE